MYRFFLLSLGLFFFACTSDPMDNWAEIDLLEHNVPVTVRGPEGTEVKSDDFGLMKDITLKGEEGYSLQVLAGEALTKEIGEIKQNELDNVKSNPYFDEVVEDLSDGFIYRNMIDSTATYNFRRVKVVGDQEIIFQMGMMGIFTEEMVRKLYAATE